MSQTRPKVSFVVPCYRLGHLLGECLTSILTQTCGDLEVLVLDDCSPDDTAAVAASFTDPRVRYLRNAQNLGHLRNYNEGVRLARGDYIWLVSADDLLRRPNALETYLALIESDDRIGYVFGPAMELVDGVEQGLAPYSVLGASNRVLEGRTFLRQSLLDQNRVVAASVMARTECYRKLGGYALDMPWAADWYAWSLFALHYRVAYCAEPMVCYRLHPDSMTSGFIATDVEPCRRDDIAVPWRMWRRAEQAGDSKLAAAYRGAVARQYGRQLAGRVYARNPAPMSELEMERSLAEHSRSEAEMRWLRPRILVSAADSFFAQGRFPEAREAYRRGLALNPAMPLAGLKFLLLSLAGRPLLELVRRYRRLGGLRL